MEADVRTNEEKYGSFWGYCKGNVQKRRWLLLTHGFALAWATVGYFSGAPWMVCVGPGVIPLVTWLGTWRNYNGKQM